MATNRDLLKQAIADAKTVKETAIANATAVLEETFAPYLREKLAAKLAEIDSMDEEMEDEAMDEAKENEGYEKMDETAEEAKEAFSMDEEMDETKSMDEELEELLRELNMDEEMDETKSMDEESMDEVINDPKGSQAHGNVAPGAQSDTDLMEAKEESEDEEDEEINIEDMSEDDLKSFIEDVIQDMVKAGELEAGHEGMEDEEGEEEIELDEEMDEESMDEGSGYTEKAKHQAMKNPHYEKMMDEMKKELDEAYKALAQVKSDLNEVNLLNSKLLYVNKIFKAKNLTENQKVKVLEAFDKATSKKEAKLVYETMIGNLNTSKTPVNESVKGMASKVISGTASSTKQPIIEVNSAFARMQKLAGIKK